MFRLFTLVIVAVTFICALQGASLNPNETSGEIGTSCSPVNCQGKIKECPYGYEKKDGCEICKCHDPSNPCGSTQRCYVDKKVDGTFAASCDSPRPESEVISKAACDEEKFVGKCHAAHRRFYYNSATKKCEKFIYGGCNGNKNNFKTQAECEATCIV